MFAFREHVISLKSHRIVKDVSGSFERHIVFVEIGSRLAIVPAELKTIVIHDHGYIPLDHTEIPYGCQMSCSTVTANPYWRLYDVDHPAFLRNLSRNPADRCYLISFLCGANGRPHTDHRFFKK